MCTAKLHVHAHIPAYQLCAPAPPFDELSGTWLFLLSGRCGLGTAEGAIASTGLLGLGLYLLEWSILLVGTLLESNAASVLLMSFTPDILA